LIQTKSDKTIIVNSLKHINKQSHDFCSSLLEL